MNEDPLAAVVGILYGLAIVAPFWIAVIGIYILKGSTP